MTTSVAVNFATGDRVELVEEYGNFFTGDAGTVVGLEGDNLVKVKMDKLNEFGRDTITCFSCRLKKSEERELQVGDIIKFNNNGGVTHKGFLGKRAEVVAIDPAKGWQGKTYFTTKMIDTATGWKDREYTPGTEVSVSTANTEVITKAEDRKSKFKVGDRVTVPYGLYGADFSKMDLAIIRENINGVYGVGAVGSDKAKAHMGKDGGWYSVREEHITLAPEPTFKTGDYVEVTKENSIFTGKRGWVVETPSHEKEGYIHINTVKKGGEPNYRFHPDQLKVVTEEPWAPKFKKGDWVEVTEKVNSEWFGIGQIVEERTKDLDISVLKMSSGNCVGHKGGFSDAELVSATKPVPKSNHVKEDFKVGQKVKALQYGGKVNHPRAGQTGEVVGIDMFIRVSLDGGGSPLFEPEELEILEQPVVKFQHKLGDYVEGHSWSEAHDGVLYKVVGFNEKAWGNYYDLEVVETGEVKKSSFSDTFVRAAEAPKPKSWAEKAKLNQSAISKDLAGRVQRVGIKVSPNEWVVTYPSPTPGADTTGVSTCNDREVVSIFGNGYIFV